MQSLQHLRLQGLIDLRITSRMRKLDRDWNRPRNLLRIASALYREPMHTRQITTLETKSKINVTRLLLCRR
jgi:hypothetical protein